MEGRREGAVVAAVVLVALCFAVASCWFSRQPTMLLPRDQSQPPVSMPRIAPAVSPLPTPVDAAQARGSHERVETAPTLDDIAARRRAVQERRAREGPATGSLLEVLKGAF